MHKARNARRVEHTSRLGQFFGDGRQEIFGFLGIVERQTQVCHVNEKWDGCVQTFDFRRAVNDLSRQVGQGAGFPGSRLAGDDQVHPAGERLRDGQGFRAIDGAHFGIAR